MSDVINNVDVHLKRETIIDGNTRVSEREFTFSGTWDDFVKHCKDLGFTEADAKEAWPV